MKKILSVFLLMLIITGCKKEKNYTVFFIVNNNCNQQLKIDYAIRVCSSQETGCSPQKMTDYVIAKKQQQLYLTDLLADDGDIKSLFYLFEIYKDGTKSAFDFWNTNKLVKTKYDKRLEFVLTVDSTFY
ncbi:MAG: hypothetical protein HY951_17520 [Bacteroidia bacterium]|nr:hypothetical protein [Bacteroidia bacterium]